MNRQPSSQAKRSNSLPKAEESDMPRLLRSGSSFNGKISDSQGNSLKFPLVLSRNGSMKQKENDQNQKGDYEDQIPEQPVLRMIPSQTQYQNEEMDHEIPCLMPQFMTQQSQAASITRKPRQDSENIYYIPQLIKYPSSHYVMPNPYVMYPYDQNYFLPNGGLSRTESRVEPEQQVKKRDSNNSQSHFQQYVDSSKKEKEQIKPISKSKVNKQKQKQQKKVEKQQQISEEKQYKQEIDQKAFEGPCHCTNSGCLKRYCRCFHNGIICGPQCQCEGCKNNDHFHNERSKAMLHVKTKCHRNKKVPKDALFELKEAYGCNCRKTNCKKNYCECFLRGQECTMDCECENCENGQDEAFQKEIQMNRSKSNRRRQLIQ